MAPRTGYEYICNRDKNHPIREANWMVTCPTCLALYGESSVGERARQEPTDG